MDERVEAFLADVLALAGEEANAIRQGVRGALSVRDRASAERAEDLYVITDRGRQALANEPQ